MELIRNGEVVRTYSPSDGKLDDFPPLLESTFRLRSENLTDWRTFETMRELLKDVRLEFALKKIDR